MAKKVLYINGKFYNKESAFADSLLCCDGVIEEVILNPMDVEKHKENADEIVDLNGRYAYPDFCGFIEEVEYDFSESGEDMLNIYDKKMAKKILNEEYDKYLGKGEKANFAVYDMDLIKNTDIQKTPPARMLIVNGEVYYDEEDFAEQQFYTLMMSQQF